MSGVITIPEPPKVGAIGGLGRGIAKALEKEENVDRILNIAEKLSIKELGISEREQKKKPQPKGTIPKAIDSGYKAIPLIIVICIIVLAMRWAWGHV